MQSVRGVLRQSCPLNVGQRASCDAIRAGCAEAKVEEVDRARRVLDAIRAECAEVKLSV